MYTNIVLKVTSSYREPYNVHLKFSDSHFTIFCNSKAGILGKLCKHKVGLLDGDSSILFDKTDEEILKQIREIISSYNILKKQTEEAQAKEKRLKEKIEHALKTGVDFFS